MIWIIILVIIFLGGIILLNIYFPANKETIDQFQRSMEKFLEGKLKPISGQPSEGFQIEFELDGHPFFYEDVPDRGFAQEARKAYLKTSIDMDFTLYFTEKPRSTTIVGGDVLIVSNISDDPIQSVTHVNVPDSLQGLNVHTSDPSLANQLFTNARMLDILLKFRNVDSRGYLSLTWKILKGTMSLEFHSAEGRIPNYRIMRRDLPSLDDYLDDLVTLVKFFKMAKSVTG